MRGGGQFRDATSLRFALGATPHLPSPPLPSVTHHSEAGKSTDSVPLKPGFHKLDKTLNTPLVCPDPEWCIGGALDDDDSICSEGHDSAFAFCSVCTILRRCNGIVPTNSNGY